MQVHIPDPESRSARAAVPIAERADVRSKRDILIALCFLASCLAYTDRVNISVAAVAMQQQFGWTQTQKGLVLSAFFIGYMLGMLPSGWLSTRFGGRRILAIAVIAWSLCTFLTPPAATIAMGALISVRIAMGLGESAMYPSAFGLVGRWVPIAGRTRATAWILSGIPVGQVAGLAVTGWILARYRWSTAFFAFGAVGVLWVVVWLRYMSDDPVADPGDAPGHSTAPATGTIPKGSTTERIPWRRLLLNVPVMAVVSGHFASNWTLYLLLAWLPSYFRDVLHLSIPSSGLLSACPWLTSFAVTNLAGPISDRLIARGLAVTNARKLMLCGGLVISAAFLTATRDVHSPLAALVLMCAATGGLGLTWCGYAPALIDVAPRHAAIVGGTTNTIGTIPGIVGVAITGWLLDVTGTYSAAFILTAIISVLSAVIFGMFFNSRPIVV